MSCQLCHREHLHRPNCPIILAKLNAVIGVLALAMMIGVVLGIRRGQFSAKVVVAAALLVVSVLIRVLFGRWRRKV